MLLSVAGGTAGVLLGALTTLANAQMKGWQTSLPLNTLAGGLGAALFVGAIAGILPAQRAACLAPVDAIRAGR